MPNWAVRVDATTLDTEVRLLFTSDTDQGVRLPELAAGDNLALIFPDHGRENAKVVERISRLEAVIETQDDYWMIRKMKGANLHVAVWRILSRNPKAIKDRIDARSEGSQRPKR
jgi:hypothetical protein